MSVNGKGCVGVGVGVGCVCTACLRMHLACERHLFESFLTALRLFRPERVNC